MVGRLFLNSRTNVKTEKRSFLCDVEEFTFLINQQIQRNITDFSRSIFEISSKSSGILKLWKDIIGLKFEILFYFPFEYK